MTAVVTCGEARPPRRAPHRRCVWILLRDSGRFSTCMGAPRSGSLEQNQLSCIPDSFVRVAMYNKRSRDGVWRERMLDSTAMIRKGFSAATTTAALLLLLSCGRTRDVSDVPS